MQAQRWGAAYPAQPLGTPCLRADQAKLAACGDFCTGAGVENAVLSAKAAAQAVQQMLRAQEG
jgi:predicted NAD/FAD-dependent oxidoreductase